jgi:hypothetical protein
MDEEDKVIYNAWRDSESYQVPMTDHGVKMADARYYGFRNGWLYAKFYAKHGHTDMKDYSERNHDD